MVVVCSVIIWFLLHVFASDWTTALVLPALSLDSLLCYFCPLQHKGKSCPNITSQCLPHQHCSSSRGRYGPVHVLSAQGCVDSELCGSHEILSHRGVKYNVSHTCCCKDKLLTQVSTPSLTFGETAKCFVISIFALLFFFIQERKKVDLSAILGLYLGKC
uniref:UPAR/Ly6 domain-containing protein n=1 Tax=Sparus aurata TaxID=8175 RepID=A0A671X459_SPAAU